MRKIDTFDKFNENENTKRFVGTNGEFVPTEQPAEGTTTIQYLEELLEWLYYHDNMDNETKKDFILKIEEQIESLLNGSGGKKFFAGKVNYTPKWSKKLENDLK